MHKKAMDLEALNDAQRKAVMHGEGPLLVLAGPGSGKTFTITQRILYLIEVMKVAPEEILVITFTKEAALSMQRRFQEQSNRILPVNFGTFHSVFYQILRKNNPSHIRQILGESQKKTLLLPILKKYRDPNQTKDDCLSFLSAISYYKNIGNMEEAVKKISEENRELFPSVFQEYEKCRKQNRSIDFDDMVYECRELLQKNPSVKAYWSRRFSHILMDEFQDINPMQYQVIKLLSGAPHNLFAVGDDDQSIYGFRGSRPACMQQFVEDFRAEKLLLDVNYRSYPAIVEASLKVIGRNKERFFKEIKPCEERMKDAEREGIEEGMHRQKREAVSLQAFTERQEEYAYLLNCLEGRNQQETCAVLFRTNVQMQCFAAGMNKRGILYEMKEKSAGIYEHFIVKDIMAYLRIAAGEEKRELFLQILNKPQRNLSREALWTEKENVTLETMKTYYDRICAGEMGLETSWAERGRKSLEILEKQIDYLKKASPYLAVQYICKIIGYEGYLKAEYRKKATNNQMWEEWNEMVAWLKEDAKGYQTLQEWIDAQKEPSKPLHNKENKESEQNKVQLMTVHASKGLEFDRVYIPDCNERVYPHGSMPDKEVVEEECRIFYVAMTRAKKSLELLYLVGTKECPRLPSRFLNPLL